MCVLHFSAHVTYTGESFKRERVNWTLLGGVTFFILWYLPEKKGGYIGDIVSAQEGE